MLPEVTKRSERLYEGGIPHCDRERRRTFKEGTYRWQSEGVQEVQDQVYKSPSE